MSLDRYRAIVPDWDRFLEAAGRPEPATLRVRTGRIRPNDLARRLEARGFRLEPVPGVPGVFRVRERPHAPSQTLEHWLGLFYLQQAVTALAAPALGARPGERVLDLCAAPGGKTTHLADLMEERGCLVADDADDRRLRALVGNVNRLGILNVVSVSADGREFPDGATFDRVLVDAPCSAEGTLRRYEGEPRPRDRSFTRYATRLQEALLRRAVALARPGGVVLYCTCTFAPEENEAVVDRVLRDLPVTLEEIPLDVPHAPGLTGFQGRDFHPELRRAWRVYPHHLDSGGLFLARLRKEGTGAPDPVPDGWRPVPNAFPREHPAAAEARIREGLRHLSEATGLAPEALERVRWMARGDSLWAHACDRWPVEAWRPGGEWRLVALGIRALKEDRRFGDHATNDFLRRASPPPPTLSVPLSHTELLGLLRGERLAADGIADGMVALEVQGWTVGRALARGGRLRHEIPKARARRLQEILERIASPGSSGAPDC